MRIKMPTNFFTPQFIESCFDYNDTVGGALTNEFEAPPVIYGHAEYGGQKFFLPIVSSESITVFRCKYAEKKQSLSSKKKIEHPIII
jgi:hypothetical protein